MQTYFFIAGSLCLVVGLIHSVLGEVLMFSRLRDTGLVPTRAAPPLQERHIRILWASWHIVSVFGWALGAILLRMAFPSTDYMLHLFVKDTIVVSTLVSALLVCVATKGRHPGWVGLLAVAVLTWFA